MLALSMLLLACHAADHSLARIRTAGVLRAGYAPEPPYAFHARDGEVTGHDPELLEAVAHAMGVGRVEWIQVEFRSLLDELEAGRFDIIGMSLAITPARAARVAFSGPTAMPENALLVAEGNPLGIQGYGDIAAHSTARLAVVGGAVEAGYATAAGVPSRRVVTVPDATTGIAAVRTGLVAAFGLTAPSLRFLTRSGSGEEGRFEVVAPLHERGPDGIPLRLPSAFAFRRADTSLRGAVNAALAVELRSARQAASAARFGFRMDWLAPPGVSGTSSHE